MRYRLEYGIFQFLRACVLILPLKSAQRLGDALGRVAYALASSRRQVALANLRHAFPEKSERELRSIARGAFRNYATSLIEMLWFPNLTGDRIRALMKPLNPEVISEGLTSGKGLVMLSGHFGNWEFIALGMAYLSGHPFSIIVQTQSNPYVDRVVNRHRCLFGNKVIPMGMAVREIIRTLSARGVIAIAPDQSGPREGVFVDFFGRRVATHQGPAVFALRSGAPMIIGFSIRQKDGTYAVKLERVPSSDLVGASDENVLELTRRHTMILEKYIREHPDHWLWMHRRWKHTLEDVQPEGKAHSA